MEKAFCPHMVILIEVLRREKANLHPRLKICPQNNNKLSSITEETLVIYCYIKKIRSTFSSLNNKHLVSHSISKSDIWCGLWVPLRLLTRLQLTCHPGHWSRFRREGSTKEITSVEAGRPQEIHKQAQSNKDFH